MITGLSSEILFEKFQIIEVLKKDEHAAVFLANHIYLSKKIILKVLNTQKISDHALVERFKREAKILAKLDNPYVIKVLDFGMFKEYFYISFEYIEGFSLRNLFKKEQLNNEQKKHLMVQLLKGLYYAHQSQIIHRDIKPENIFVDNSLNLKIGDFGLALSQEDNFVTNPYSIVGTPSYMSPEQVRGAKLNAQSDLFSAGVVLYEMYVGKNPFLKENVSLTLNEIMAYDEDIISKGLSEQEQEVKDVIYHLIRKNVKDRCTTALESLNDLNISVEQPTLVINAKEPGLNKGRFKAVAAITLIAVIGIVFLLLRMFDSPDNTANPNITFGDTTTQQNTKPTKEALSANAKIDTVNNNLPLIGDPKTDNQSTTQLEQKPNLQEQQTEKTVRNGWLRVRAVVGTRVIVDGESYPEALSKVIYLPEGEYTVRFENDDFPSYTEKVKIDSKQETIVRADFNNLVAFVTFDVRPEAQIYIDGSKRGECPPVLRMVPLKPGIRRITLRNSTSKDVDTTINVNKGDTLIFSYKFKK
ncbi:MAG: serine/threonine protein kinase with PASTA sensor(s) [Ignavibacteria bacterium]|nr:MAG: serine/threonine protein kinase with PASTA sensor(s) [Ignavibacteria bacterium]KAF0160100.1 MAG: serine/threonine protein kinase with PASTA sensor(s) [Ignavibacteria bacterium]